MSRKLLTIKDLRSTRECAAVFVSASTRCFSDKSLAEACFQLDDLEYDKVELWFDENSDHLKPSVVAADPNGFFARYREMTRLSPTAFCLAHDIPLPQFRVLCNLAKQFRIAQMTVVSSPLGTPFNAEIDRLRELLKIGTEEGVLVSMKTRTGCLSEDPNTAVELCQSTPGLGITLDPSYFIAGPHRGQSFDQVYPYVYHVHLRDSSADQVQVQIGLGVIDYSTVITQLRRYRYNRGLSVELFPEQLEAGQRPIELRKMRLLLESLL